MTPEDHPETVSLREFIERTLDERDRIYGERFSAQEKAVIAALAAVKEANAKSETSMERRFDSVNEFRQTLTDQAATFVTIPSLIAIQEKIEELRNTIQDKIDAAVSAWDKRHQEVVDRQSATDRALVALTSEKAGAKVQATETKDNTARTMSLVIGIILMAEFVWNVLSPVITKILLTK